MIGLSAARLNQFRKRDRADFYPTRFDVNDASICRHLNLLITLKAARMFSAPPKM
jgi:hypothetical protein